MDKKKRCPIWAHLKNALAKMAGAFILYLDDLLLIGGGGCLVAAAGEVWGRPAALAAAGVWLCILALVVAKSRKGGGG